VLHVPESFQDINNLALLLALIIGGLLARSGDGARELAWVRTVGVSMIVVCLALVARTNPAGNTLY